MIRQPYPDRAAGAGHVNFNQLIEWQRLPQRFVATALNPNVQMTADKQCLVVDTRAAQACGVTLPPANQCQPGQKYTVINIAPVGGANVTIVADGGDTLNEGQDASVVIPSGGQFDAVPFQGQGNLTGWYFGCCGARI